MIKFVQNMADRFHMDNSNDRVLDLFFKGVAFLALILIIPKIFVADFYFGSGSIVPPYDFQEGILSYPVHLLEAYPGLMWPFIVTYIGALAFSLFRRHWLASVLVFVIHLNFFNKAYLLYNSADLLLSLFFAAMLIQDLLANSRHKTLYTNGILKALQLQICLIYIVASLYKLSGDIWSNGHALELLMQNHLFGNNLIANLSPSLLMILTYFILLNQVLFPVLVWFKSMKPIVLISGIMIHLGTAIFLGLYDFGLMMCLAYVLFLSHKNIASIKTKTKALLPSKKWS